MTAIYLYLIVCTGSGCSNERFPMRDLPTCERFAATFKASFPPNTTENEQAFAIVCGGEKQIELTDGTWRRSKVQKD